MRIRAIALNTFRGLLRNKIIILLAAGFLCIVLLMMAPLLLFKAAANTMSASQAQGMVLSTLTGIMTMVSAFGSLLAIWAAADVVSAEMRSGTILAIMARPVRRWEFLLGKYLGVQLLMLIYVIGMLALSYLLTALGGQVLHGTPWVLIVYPMVRYAVYSAIAVLFVTLLHPVVSFAIVMVISVIAAIVAPPSPGLAFLPDWLRNGVYIVLPSTGLLSEARFLTLTQSALRQTPWTNHLTALTYGLDYALVCFLLAVWSFRKRSLVRN
jgi:ABC-type transport system involved in multi-copper enzyme maturation permease subunit